MWIVDGHEDIAVALVRRKTDFASLDLEYSLSLPGLKSGGVGLVLATIFAPDRGGLEDAPAETQFGLYESLAEKYPDDLRSVGNLEDLEDARGTERIGFALLLEGADPIREVDDLEDFRSRGVRLVGLTWNHANRYAGGVSSEIGLTAAGVHLLEAMSDLAMVLDVSHLNERSFWDCMERWGGPVTASHSNARAVAGHPRNLTDDQIRALSEKGGVIGLNFHRGFLVDKAQGKRRATMEDLMRHASHISEIGGEACLGLGTDFDGGFGPDQAVEGCARASELRSLDGGLASAGFTDSGIEAILSGNWLRVLEPSLGS
ncbi:MAG: dipeptidase [Planctomycetota bacterium]|jgi:membrane dipeptidase